MNVAARTKLTLAVLAAIIVVTGVGFVATMYLILRDAEQEPPWLHAYANGHVIEVDPFRYCPLAGPDETPEDCVDGETTTIAVPRDENLLLSLPIHLADAPWHLLAIYEGPDGTTVEQEQQHIGGGTSTIVVPGQTGEPPMRLLGVEFAVIGGFDADGNAIANGVWSIKNSAG